MRRATSSKAPIREHEIQAGILEWLKLKRIFHYRTNAGAMGGTHKGKRWYVRFGRKGQPDILVIYRGIPYGIEVKAPGKEQSREQVEFQTEFERAGGRYVLAFCLEDVMRSLETR